eukprot:NODE_361_length_8796_cov_0.460274.p2 type:complete len:264 gc:universal NODE_361_length_8796_cov_0.460274:2124-1333(-)
MNTKLVLMLLCAMKKQLDIMQFQAMICNLDVNIYITRQIFQRDRLHDPFEMINEESISHVEFKRIFRFSPDAFQLLHDKLRPLWPISLRGRPKIKFSTRLGIYLCFVGHNIDYCLLGCFFGIGTATAYEIVWEMVDLVLQIKNETIKLPNDPNVMAEMVEGMSQSTVLEGAIAAIDGCHIPLDKPDGVDERSIYNFKGWYSHLIVIVCDYRQRIIGVTTGHTGCCADSSIVYIFNVGKRFKFIQMDSETSPFLFCLGRFWIWY